MESPTASTLAAQITRKDSFGHENSHWDGDEEHEVHSDTEVDYFAKKLPAHLMRDDPSLNWFQKPHTLTFLVIVGIVLIYGAFAATDDTNLEYNIKMGLGAGALSFLVFSMLYLHDGPFRRPHPVFWRLVMGCSILYLMSLVFLLFQSRDWARQFLKYFDPKLGVPLPERSYAEHCEIYTPDHPESSFKNVWDTLNDEFVAAHVVGWFFKMLLLRDVYLCLFLSALFEVWELTLQHQLPNFAECWWDHIILDILVCNNIGIVTGWLTCRYLLKVKEYNWTGFWASRKGKVIQTVIPTDFDEYRWDLLSHWGRFLSVILFCLAISIIELNAFYLKYELWVPPPHPLNIARLILWMFLGQPAAREYYQFVSDPNCHKMGSMAWMGLFIFSTEFLLCVKWGQGMFPNPIPDAVFWPWVIVLVVGGITAVVYFSWKETTRAGDKSGRKSRRQKKKQKGQSMPVVSGSDKNSAGGHLHHRQNGSKKNAAKKNKRNEKKVN